MNASLLLEEPLEPEPAEPLVKLARASDLPPSPDERRLHRRHALHELTWLKAARLKYGPAVNIVDLSVGGALFETETPLRPGSDSVLEIVTDTDETLVPCRVLRCHVANLHGRLRYRGACEFKRPFHSPGESRLQTPGLDVPLFDGVKLDRTLKEIVERYLSGLATPSVPRAESGPVATIEALNTLSAEAGHRGLDPLARTLRALLTEIVPVLGLGERARFQVARVESHLSKTLPFLRIRLQESRPLIRSA